MPKILLFVNHWESTISHCFLYGKRLGMDVFLGDASFNTAYETALINPASFSGMRCAESLKKYIFGELDNVVIRDISYSEFMNMNFDYILATMPLFVPLIEAICHDRPYIKKIAYSGNRGFKYPEDYIFIGSSKWDYETHNGKKALIFKEILPQFTYSPMSEQYNQIVRSVVNYIWSYPWYSTILDFEKKLNEKGYSLILNGLDCRDGPYPNYEVGVTYYQYAKAILHLKHGDGYGLGMAHILSCGTPVLTDFSFYEGSSMFPMIKEWGFHVQHNNSDNICEVFLSNREYFTEDRKREQAKFAKEFFTYQASYEKVFHILE